MPCKWVAFDVAMDAIPFLEVSAITGFNFECHWFIFLPCDYSFLRNRTLKMSRDRWGLRDPFLKLGFVVVVCYKNVAFGYSFVE